MKKTIFFDLDGTIINSEAGITNCIRYVLDYWGMEHPPQEDLLCFIGPPLREQYMKVFGWDYEKAEFSVHKFRERFDKLGLFECEIYDGVKELIEMLYQKGYQIALASSKHEDACVRIIEFLHLENYFTGIFGATRDGSIGTKQEVLEMAMHKLGISKEEAILVGDTKFDVLGAKAAGIDCLGVSYGFGSREELVSSGAVKVVDTAKEVGEYLERF